LVARQPHSEHWNSAAAAILAMLAPYRPLPTLTHATRPARGAA
jgi:hypothetical protein